MTLYLSSLTFDRKTGKKINEKVLNKIKVEYENDPYNTLTKIFFDEMKKSGQI